MIVFYIDINTYDYDDPSQLDGREWRMVGVTRRTHLSHIRTGCILLARAPTPRCWIAGARSSARGGLERGRWKVFPPSSRYESCCNGGVPMLQVQDRVLFHEDEG